MPLFRRGVFTVQEIERELLLGRRFYHGLSDPMNRLIDVHLPEKEVEAIHFVDFFRYDAVSIEQIKARFRESDGVAIERSGADLGAHL